MKKTIVVYTLFFLLFSEARAQKKLDIGIRIGYGLATETVNNKFARGAFAAFHVGPQVRWNFSEKHRVSLEVLLSKKGSPYIEIHGSGGNNLPMKEDYKEHFFYLDLPILFNYKPIGGFYLEGGVQPSVFLLRATSSPYTSSSAHPRKMRNGDFSLVVGVGYEIKKVTIGIRGTVGLVNILESGTVQNLYSYYRYPYGIWQGYNIEPDNNSYKNTTLILTCGFSLW